MMRYTEMSLMEQLKISSKEIARRKEYFSFTSGDVENIVSMRNAVRENMEIIVHDFYEKILAFDEMDRLIGDSETLLRLKQYQKQYIFSLFDGVYDEEYVHSRLRIGMVHKRIGVEPKYYISAMHSLGSILRLYSTATDEQAESIDKILMFDLSLVIDTYINNLMEEVRKSREELAHYSESLEQEIADRTRQLREQARLDGLTGLLNQRAFYEELKKESARNQRRRHPLSLVYFDLDGFKQLNDSQGHKRGDEILIAVAETLRRTLRSEDIAARYGGDEFCIILPESSATDAENACKRICETMKTLTEGSGISCSMGISSSTPEQVIDSETLVKLADKAMYAAKKEKGFAIKQAHLL